MAREGNPEQRGATVLRGAAEVSLLDETSECPRDGSSIKVQVLLDDQQFQDTRFDDVEILDGRPKDLQLARAHLRIAQNLTKDRDLELHQYTPFETTRGRVRERGGACDAVTA